MLFIRFLHTLIKHFSVNLYVHYLCIRSIDVLDEHSHAFFLHVNKKILDWINVTSEYAKYNTFTLDSPIQFIGCESVAEIWD